jgi:hypothetical protein
MNNKTTESFRAIVRPILTLMFSFAFVAGCVMGAIDPKYLVYATFGILAFWFGERYFSKFTSLLTSQNQGAAPPAAPPEAASPPSLPPAAPPPAPVVEAPPEPLDVEAFHNQVLADVGPRLGEINPATVFSEARDKGGITTCQNIKQAQDYWDYLVPLAYAAEAYVKEKTEGQTAAAGGCKGVAAPEYVAMQLELAKTIRRRDDVYALARSGFDWKTALGINATLRGVGVLAVELLQRAWEV